MWSCEKLGDDRHGFLVVFLLHKVAGAFEPMDLDVGEELLPHLRFFLTERDVAWAAED